VNGAKVKVGGRTLLSSPSQAAPLFSNPQILRKTPKKKAWGTLKGAWGPHDVRNEIIEYVNHWTTRAEQPAQRLLGWLDLGTSKFHDWKHRYGKANEHNAHILRD
jgi:hypothetical protein